MQYVNLMNQRTNTTIAENVLLADTFWLRLRGLLGRPKLQPKEGLWLIPCRQVHMHGMKYPLSIWFLDCDNRVCHLIDDLKPGECSPSIKDAKTILEFPKDWGQKTGIKIGDLLIRSPECSLD
jgi:uncharacterized membrane protein (UPF0127 family)